MGSPSPGRSPKLTAREVTDTGNAEWCDVSFSLSLRRARELHLWSPRPWWAGLPWGQRTGWDPGTRFGRVTLGSHQPP